MAAPATHTAPNEGARTVSTYRLVVNGDHFFVPTEDHLVGWMRSVTAAARRGGGFVRVTDTAGILTSLLITPLSTVTVREMDLTQSHTLSQEQFAENEIAFFDY